MRVLVLGAGGFVGRHIVARLVAQGRDVIVCGRRPDHLIRRFPTATAMKVDLTDARAQHVSFWEPKLEGVDAIVNAAGVLTATSEAEAWAVHLLGPRALSDAAGDRPFVHISAPGIEADTVYARTKRAMEDALIRSLGTYTILRPSLVYGSTSDGGLSAIRAVAALPGFVPTILPEDPEAAPIHVGDLAAVAVRAIDEPRLHNHVLELGGPDRMTLSEVTQGLRGWLGLAHAPVVRPPFWVIRAIAYAGDALGFSSMNTVALGQFQTRIDADLAERLTDIGFRPRRFSDALALEPSGPQDLWHAKLYFWRPALRLILATMWAATAVMAGASTVFASILEPLVGSGFWAQALSLGYAAVSAVFSALLFRGRRAPFLAAAQLLWVVLFLVALTAAAPSLWFDPFGVLTKSLLIVPLILLHGAIDRTR